MKAVRPVAVDGVEGMELNGALGISRLAWRRNSLIAERRDLFTRACRCSRRMGPIRNGLDRSRGWAETSRRQRIPRNAKNPCH